MNAFTAKENNPHTSVILMSAGSVFLDNDKELLYPEWRGIAVKNCSALSQMVIIVSKTRIHGEYKRSSRGHQICSPFCVWQCGR